MLRNIGLAVVLVTIVTTQSACKKQVLSTKFAKSFPSNSQVSVVQNQVKSPAITTKTELPTCVKTKCNCRNFANQREAQAVLEAFPNDPHKLDRNKNGIACESLPK